MRNFVMTCAVIGSVALFGAPALAQGGPPQYGPPVTLEQAQKAIAAAVEESKKNNWFMAISVVSPSGDLVAFGKMDNTQIRFDCDLAAQSARGRHVQASEQGVPGPADSGKAEPGDHDARRRDRVGRRHSAPGGRQGDRRDRVQRHDRRPGHGGVHRRRERAEVSEIQERDGATPLAAPFYLTHRLRVVMARFKRAIQYSAAFRVVRRRKHGEYRVARSSRATTAESECARPTHHKSIVLGAKISSSPTRRGVKPCSWTYCAMVSSTGRAAFTP